jgi:hypothetical protein
MDQEKETMDEKQARNERLKKIISEFDHKFSMMSETDQKNFAVSWIKGLHDGGDKPI